jgi:hypothetical protein
MKVISEKSNKIDIKRDKFWVINMYTEKLNLRPKIRYKEHRPSLPMHSIFKRSKAVIAYEISIW